MRRWSVWSWMSAEGHFSDPESRDKALVMGIGLPVAVLVSVGMVLLYAAQGDWGEVPIAATIAVSFIFITLGWARWRSFEFVTHCMAAALSFVFSASALYKGDASYLALLAVVPVSAAFYATPRVGLTWSVLAVLVTTATAVGLELSLPPPWQPGQSIPYLARYVLSVICLAGMASAFQVSRTRTLRRMNAAREAAEAASRAKTRFLAAISHDLRTPLNGILGTLELSRLRRDLPPEVQEHLQVINDSGATLLALINDLLDLARVEAGRLEISPRSFDPRAAIEHVGRLHEARAAARGLTLGWRCDWLGDRWLHGDPVRLQQVLHNLVGNAVKFTERGEVQVTASLTPAQATGRWRLEVAVRDTGRGMTEQQLGTLFVPFTQVHASDAATGSGLGLAISRALVEQMGGVVEVRSSLGHGSTFAVRLELPEAAADRPAAPAASREALAGPPLRGHVLVVDDNAINRTVAAALLQHLGLEVTLAEGGRAAVELALKQRFDLVLMDLQMPDLDGAEATRRLRAHEGSTRRTPVLALTASALPEELAACLAAGMDEALTKPIQLPELRRALSRWLEPR